MNKKLSPFVYPIIAACICFVIGIVLFSVALALKWGTTLATLQLYAWLILAAICAVLSVVFKFYPIGDQPQSAEGQDGGKQLAQELQNTLGEMQDTLKKIEPIISRSGEILSDLRTAIIGEETIENEEEK